MLANRTWATQRSRRRLKCEKQRAPELNFIILPPWEVNLVTLIRLNFWARSQFPGHSQGSQSVSAKKLSMTGHLENLRRLSGLPRIPPGRRLTWKIHLRILLLWCLPSGERNDRVN